VVDRARLENEYGFTAIEGSNPSLSAQTGRRARPVFISLARAHEIALMHPFARLSDHIQQRG
jgi:hypothetical protein